MEHGKPIDVEIEEFFQDMKPKGRRWVEFTEKEKRIIIKAYEDGYSLIAVSDKLHVSPKRMRRFYEEYKRSR